MPRSWYRCENFPPCTATQERKQPTFQIGGGKAWNWRPGSGMVPVLPRCRKGVGSMAVHCTPAGRSSHGLSGSHSPSDPGHRRSGCLVWDLSRPFLESKVHRRNPASRLQGCCSRPFVSRSTEVRQLLSFIQLFQVGLVQVAFQLHLLPACPCFPERLSRVRCCRRLPAPSAEANEMFSTCPEVASSFFH